MKLKKIISTLLVAALALVAVPAFESDAAGSISVTTNAGSGSLIGYYGGYIYYDYDYNTYESKEVKSMVENQYVSGDVVGHIGHAAYRDGYGFAGWAEKENGTPIDMSTYKVTKNVTLYPVWSNDYSVVTVADNGRYLTGSFYIANGASLKEMGLREAYDKVSGYPFKGFATKKNSTKVIDLDTYKVTKDVTLYPVYGGLNKTLKDDKGNKYKLKAVGSQNRVFDAEFIGPKNKKIKSLSLQSYFYDSNDRYINVSSIGKKAFADCKNLTKLTISYPSTIGAQAFSGCDKLKEIAIVGYYGDKSGIKNCFKNSNIKKVHCDEYSVSDYKKVFTKKNTGSKTKIKIVGDFIGY